MMPIRPEMKDTITYKVTRTGTRRISGVTIDGVTRSVVDWSSYTGVPVRTLRQRLRTMSIREAILGEAVLVSPSDAWPVPPSTLANTKHTGS